MRYSASQKLLGTIIEVTVISDDTRTPNRIASVFDYFASIEQEFSRFLPDSSLSILNTHKKMSASKRFLELITLSKDMYVKTGGLFNPLVSVASLGYSHTFDEGNFEPTKGVVNTDFGDIQIDGDIITLRPGQSLDFGGIGKGWAVDGATSLLRLFGYDNFFINAGGDIFASGVNENGDDGWVIGIESPFNEEIIASVLLKDMAIATSGSYKRKWDVQNKHYHHLINPLTGENENGIQSVAIIAADCASSDGFTKSIFNARAQDGIRLIEQNNMDGLIITSEKKVLYTKGLVGKYDLTFAESE